MQQLRSYISVFMFWALSLSLLLTGCQKVDKGGNPTAQGEAHFSDSSPNASGGGGLDGSGGNTTESSLADVEKVYQDEMKALPERLKWMQSNLDLDEVIYDYSYNKKGAQKMIRAFFHYNEAAKSENKILTALENNKIKFLPQNEPCEAQDKTHAGSAKGDFNHAEICISFEKLKSVSPKVLNEEIFALIIHELSHVAGFSEEDAVTLQTLLTKNPEVYRSANLRTGTTNQTLACDKAALEKEINFVKKSEYWNEKLKQIAQLLSGEQAVCSDSQNKGEDKLMVFANKAKLIIETVKFNQHELAQQIVSNATGETYATLVDKNESKIQFMASLSVGNADLLIQSLTAHNSTNAYCSPKALIANVLANIPDILEMKCGDIDKVNSLEKIKSRINEELAILSEEK